MARATIHILLLFMAATIAATPLEHTLDAHQEQLGGGSACSVVTLYWSLYLLHEQQTPSCTQLMRYMRQACLEWANAQLKPQMHTQEVLKHFPAFASYLRMEAEHQGRMLRSSGTQVWADDMGTGWQITPLVQVLDKLAASVQVERKARSCIFARDGHSIVLGLMPTPFGGVRYELLDSLGQKVLKSQTAPSASWVQCHTSVDAVRYLEQYYPLYDDLKSPIQTPPEKLRLEHAETGYCFYMIVLSLVPQRTPIERSAY